MLATCLSSDEAVRGEWSASEHLVAQACLLDVAASLSALQAVL